MVTVLECQVSRRQSVNETRRKEWDADERNEKIKSHQRFPFPLVISARTGKDNEGANVKKPVTGEAILS